MQTPEQLVSAGWQQFLWWILSLCFHPNTCCCVPLWNSEVLLCPRLWGSFWECGNFSSFTTLIPNTGPFQILCLFFFLYLLPYLILWRLACLFGSLWSSASIQKCSVGGALHADIFFRHFVQRTVISLSYPSAILKVLSVFKVCFTWCMFCYPGFLFISISMEYLFHPFTFSLSATLDMKWISW